MLTLLACQRSGKLHVDSCVEIPALLGPADDGHAMPFEPEYLAWLRSLRDLQANRSGHGRHLRFAAENRGRQRNGHFGVEIVALALEHRMRTDPHAQIKIAGGAAARACFTLASGADP